VISYGDVEFPGTERFRIVRRLGEGGMGVVYEALDLERNLPVALKTLRGLTPDGLLRFKQEFRLLRDLVHPNFVCLHELHTFGEWWFFTMELVEGRDVLEHVRGHPSDETLETGVGHRAMPRLPVSRRGEPPARHEQRGFDEPRLRAAMAQLARALTALHARGLVHRDIKPHNILVGRDNRIVLVDFGIMVDPDKRMSRDDLVVGTSDYMAPEQAAGGELGAATDWYAVGAVLYEALTGTVPFIGSALQVMIDKQKEIPVPPSARAFGVPPDLEAVCMDLLKRDPKARPQGLELLKRLNADEAVRDTHYGPRGSFVGRERELALLEDIWRAAAPGTPTMLFFQGVPGVGKSALLHQYARRVMLDGACVLEGRCHLREALPFNAFDEVMDAFSRAAPRWAGEQIGELLPMNVDVAARAFPVLRRIEAIHTAPIVSDADSDRSLLAGAIIEMFSRLALHVPLVVVIDDLDRADAESLGLLERLVKKPPRRFLLVATLARPWNELPALQAIAADFYDAGGRIEHFTVGPMSTADAERLALSRMGGRSAKERSAVARIAALSGGQPFLVDVLASVPKVAAARTLDDALWARLAALTPELREALELLAGAGGGLPQASLGRAMEWEDAMLASRVDELRGLGLVRVAGLRLSDRVELTHDEVRRLLQGRASPATASRLSTLTARS
jgi:hypothetical protein